MPIARANLGLRRVLLAVSSALAACSGGTEPSPPHGDISLISCGSIWVAVQDGDGPWVQVPPQSGSTYEFSLPSGRGGVARVRAGHPPSPQRLDIYYGTAGEIASVAATADSSDCAASVRMTGSLAGGSANADRVGIHIGLVHNEVPDHTGSFDVYGMAGFRDLYAMLIPPDLRVTTMLMRPDVSVTSGGTLAPLDFSGSEAFVTVSSTVSVSGLTGPGVLVKSSYLGLDQSTYFELNHLTSEVGDDTFQYESVPAGKMRQGDLQLIEAVESGSQGSRQAGVYYTMPDDRTVTLGPPLNTPSGSVVATTPNTRMRVQVASQSEYSRTMTADFRQALDVAEQYYALIHMTVTANYVGEVPMTWDVTIPDLSGAEGWQASWGLRDIAPDEQLFYWSMTGQGGAIPLLDASIDNGSLTRNATSAGPMPALPARFVP